MNTVFGAVTSLVVLSASGAFPALALARARLVAIPLMPLTGAVAAGLSVTAMTVFGGSVISWFVTLSVLGVVATAYWWRRNPSARPWNREKGRSRATLACLGGLGLSTITVGFGLSALRAPMVSYDARITWMVHPSWYLAGRALTVAALRNPVLTATHPTYPPLLGGAVAVSWFVTGMHTDRLGVVIVSLLGASAALGAASALVEVARRLAGLTEDRNRRTFILAVGVGSMAVLAAIVFAVAQTDIVDGHADALWSAAAVGAVAYGLILSCETANLGAAAILAVVAGTTKLEGSMVAAIIVGLIAVRMLVLQRRAGQPLPCLPAAVFAIGSWLIIGSWPLVTRLLDALPDTTAKGARQGTDSSRLSASVAKASSDLHVVAIGVAVAILGSLFLRGTRREAELGSDAWAWTVLVSELGIILTAYVVGPGNVHSWLHHSMPRTLTFPILMGFWIMVTWAVIAVSKISFRSQPETVLELPQPEPSAS